MHSPFAPQLEQAAALLSTSLQEAHLSAEIDPASWREYSVKLKVSFQGKSCGLINLYYSPKRTAFTMRTHEVKGQTTATLIEKRWERLEASNALNLAATASPAAKATTSPAARPRSTTAVASPPKQAATASPSSSASLSSPQQGGLFAPFEPEKIIPPPRNAPKATLRPNASSARGETPEEKEAAPSAPLASSAGDLGQEEADAPPRAPKEELSEKLASLKSIHLYVDGSFISGKIGYGFALITPSGELVFDQFGAIQDPDLRQQRQVSGELIATQQGILWCLRHHLPQVEVFYDYAGVEFWVTGAWRAKQDLTQTYRDFMRACPIKIRWHKVASHTGVHWNEHVDQLAKRGAFHGRPTPLLSRHDLP